MEKNLLDLFFEENYRKFKIYIRRRFNTLTEYDAEDIVQQTIMKLLAKNDDFLSINNLSAYMYTALQNSAKDHFKKESRTILVEDHNQIATKSAEDELLYQELRQQIMKAINDLDPKSRYVFVETELKGRSYNSLMEETGEKLGTLLARKSRVKKKLQNHLLEYTRRS